MLKGCGWRPSRTNTPSPNDTRFDWQQQQRGYRSYLVVYPSPHYSAVTLRYQRLFSGVMEVVNSPNDNGRRCLVAHRWQQLDSHTKICNR